MTRRKMTMLAVAALGMLLSAAPAEARRGRGGGWGQGGGPGWGGGWGQGRGHGPMKRCGKALLHAPPEVLKDRMGLRDDQVFSNSGAQQLLL